MKREKTKEGSFFLRLLSHCVSRFTFYAPGYSEEDVDALLDAHERAVAAGAGVLKDGRRSRVTRVERGGQAFCVKEYLTLGWLDRIKDILRGSRGRRAWNAARLFAERGITTPQPVALVEGRGHCDPASAPGGTLKQELERGTPATEGEVRVPRPSSDLGVRQGASGHRSYLVTRFVEGSLPLNLLLAERFGRGLGAEELAAKRSMVRELGRWLRGVHDLGVYHDDWSTKNILAVQAAGGWRFYFLDLESVVPRKPLTARRRAKNLGQLSDAPFGITRTDRMRFLVAYAGGDRALTRGRFPRDVLAAARRRDEEWARVVEKTRRRQSAIRNP